MSIPEFRLGQPFLFATKHSQGIGVKGLSGARMAEREGRAVTLERFGERLFLLQKPMRFTAEEDTPMARVLDASFGDSMLESTRIV